MVAHRSIARRDVTARLAHVEGRVRRLRTLVDQDTPWAELVAEMMDISASVREVGLMSVSRELDAKTADVEALGPLMEQLRKHFHLP